MIQHGTNPIVDKPTDNSFRKTFGATPVDVASIPDFNLHFGPVPDQNAIDTDFDSAPQPYGCTNVSTCQVGANEDKRRYNRDFQEGITHANAKGGYDVRASLQTSIDFGLQAKGESPQDARKHRRPMLFRVGANPDFFTGALTAMWLTKRTISTGTPWYTEWSDAATGNIHTYDAVTGTYKVSGGGVRTNIAPVPTLPIDPYKLPWHDWVICGKKTVGGIAHLICEPHQGENFGDAGFLYFPAATLNYAMVVAGTCEFTVAEADPNVVQTVGHVFMRNLYYGLVDDEVQELQRGLIYLGYPILHAVTRIFGSETKAALFRFQNENGISDDGSHCGPITRYALNKALNPSQTIVGSILLFIHTFIGI